LDTRYGEPGRIELDLSSPFALFQMFSEMMVEAKMTTAPSIAVVHVDGMIVDGKSEEGGPLGRTAGSTTLRRALDKAAEDEAIKAVVLRVDSPGGSALASEVIWGATQRVRAAKPFVVSMGNVAASGGYYISCGAERIFADPGTITGSIGIVGGKLVTTGMWDKLGVHWYSNHRGEHAQLFSTAREFTEHERREVYRLMNETYGTFKQRVTDGRGNRIRGDLEALAGGRVYTGVEALEIGLVDELGGLDEAIAYAARQAHVSDYDIQILPPPKTLMDILKEAFGLDDETEISATRAAWRQADSLLQAALPALAHLDPPRAAALLTGLQRAEMLMQGGVLAVCPFDLVVR
jgi:protease-4